METLNKIEFTKEFTQFCDIFGFTATEVLQEFVNNVDIAQYMCYPLDPYRWANLFMMEYLIALAKSEDILMKYGEFGEKWATMMRKDKSDALENTRTLLDQWHAEVLENRIHEIMKGDEEDDDDLITED